MNPSLTSITLICGIVFLVVGLLFKMFQPKNINSLYGYRTSSSKRNLDTWKSANNYSSTFMIFGGLVLTVIGFLSMLLPDTGKTGAVFAFALVISFIILLAVRTEKHLNKFFDKEGKRKTI